MELRVRVKPRARESRVVGEKEGVLEVAVSAPPADGEANAELIATLAKHYGVTKSSIEIVSGQSSRLKRVRITPR